MHVEPQPPAVHHHNTIRAILLAKADLTLALNDLKPMVSRPWAKENSAEKQWGDLRFSQTRYFHAYPQGLVLPRTAANLRL
ncbi:MAG: hypothetical protein COW15_11285 [Shewanella sp. CG12_big_fil_rev_8_21_14_0_65_47_15]|nr:MAG: hypothetical protein COW15_11285 [Shewanella sp. CG12_big_fil_rev_8_21_14_0_65_47_15]